MCLNKSKLKIEVGKGRNYGVAVRRSCWRERRRKIEETLTDIVDLMIGQWRMTVTLEEAPNLSMGETEFSGSENGILAINDFGTPAWVYMEKDDVEVG